MDKDTIGIVVSIFLALTGYLATYQSDLRRVRRKERLELVDKRINEFYGPLYVLVQDSFISHKAFLTKIDKPTLHGSEQVPQAHELAEWRIWVETVFMPLHQRIEHLILANAYLIREEQMPECLLRYVTHVSGWKVVIKKWSEGDFTEHVSILAFPDELNEYAATSYCELKEEQLRLIGKLR